MPTRRVAAVYGFIGREPSWTRGAGEPQREPASPQQSWLQTSSGAGHEIGDGKGVYFVQELKGLWISGGPLASPSPNTHTHTYLAVLGGISGAFLSTDGAREDPLTTLSVSFTNKREGGLGVKVIQVAEGRDEGGSILLLGDLQHLFGTRLRWLSEIRSTFAPTSPRTNSPRPTHHRQFGRGRRVPLISKKRWGRIVKERLRKEGQNEVGRTNIKIMFFNLF